jgi:hypothetical protein
MEVFVFGLIALSKANKQQEQIVPEPTEFQSFDLRALGQFNNAGENSLRQASGRTQLFAAQTVS